MHHHQYFHPHHHTLYSSSQSTFLSQRAAKLPNHFRQSLSSCSLLAPRCYIDLRWFIMMNSNKKSPYILKYIKIILIIILIKRKSRTSHFLNPFSELLPKLFHNCSSKLLTQKPTITYFLGQYTRFVLPTFP